MREIKLAFVDEIIYYDETDEGMPIYLWVNEKINNFYMTLNVKYGSVDTEFKLSGEKKNTIVPNGIAHFLEHISFNEEDGFSAFDYFKQFGSSINAFTSFDITAYEVIGSSHFNENLNHLLDYVMTPCIKKRDVEKEKGIIIEEISMGDNQPARKMFFGAYEALFHKNKRRVSIAGDVDSVTKTSVNDLELVYNNFYHPKNMFVVVTGNFNPYEASAIIKENLANKEFREYKNPIRKKVREPLEVKEKEKIIEANIEIPKLQISLKISRKKFNEKDDLLLRIYLSIILKTNFGYTSDLREELMSKELVSDFNVSREIIGDFVIISVIAETKYLKEVEKKIVDKLSCLEISEETLERRKKSNIANMVLGYDSIESVNAVIQDWIMEYGEIIDNLYGVYKNVSLKKLLETIDVIDTTNMSIIKLVASDK